MSSPPSQPRVIVTGRQRPIEVSLMVAAVGMGLANALGFGPSPTIAATGIPLYGIIWGGLLAVSGLLGLWSLRLELPGALIYERIALVGISTCFMTWSIALAFGLNSRTISTFLIVLGLGVGTAVRAYTITRDLRLLVRATAGK